VLTPKVAYQICELGLDAVRTVMRSSAPVTKATPPFLLVACEPLVANSTTDAVASTQLRHREAIAECVADELNSLFHR